MPDFPSSTIEPTEGASRSPAIIVLLIAVVALHLPSLFSPFFIDDYVYVTDALKLGWQGLAEVFSSSTLDTGSSGAWWTPSGELPFYRPIAEMGFALDAKLWGAKPFGFHLTNLLLHVACTFGTYKLAQRLLGTNRMAWATAAVFALHPVHTEAVAWISGRFDLLVCLFMLAATLAYLRYSDSTRSGSIWLGVSLLCFVLGLGSKETALLFPVIVVAIAALLLPVTRRNTTLWRHVWAIIIVGVGAVSYLGLRFTLFGGLGQLPPPYGIDLSTPLAAIQNIGWSLAVYLFDFVLMIQVDAFYMDRFWEAHPTLMVLTLLVSLIVVAAAARIAWRTRTFRFGLLWAVLFTAPSLMAMPGERNVYLSSVGVALIVGAVLRELSVAFAPGSRRAGWLRGAIYSIAGVGILLTLVEQVGMWSLASANDRLLTEIVDREPNPVPHARIYVVHLSPLNAVAFEQALRLRYGRSDLSGVALTVSPSVEATVTDEITQTGVDSIRITRSNRDFFDSFPEQFLLFSSPVEDLPESAARHGLELIDPPTSYEGLRTLHFRLPAPLDDPSIVIFHWDNESVTSPLDFSSLLTQTALRRYVPGDG